MSKKMFYFLLALIFFSVIGLEYQIKQIKQPTFGWIGCSTDLECYGHGGYEIPEKDGVK